MTDEDIIDTALIWVAAVALAAAVVLLGLVVGGVL